MSAYTDPAMMTMCRPEIERMWKRPEFLKALFVSAAVFGILAPVLIGATVRITTRAIDKFEKRGRRYLRHSVIVEDAVDGTLYIRETRDIMSL